MKVIRKINNNAAICLDSQGNEVVAFGTGIGFPSVPYDLKDLSMIQRTFYDVDSNYSKLINQIDENVLQVSIKIVDLFKNRMPDYIGSNIVFTLADHIDFAITRYKKNIKIDSPLQYEIQNLYEVEYEVGVEALRIINSDLKIRLPKEEASNIALHLINARAIANQESRIDVEAILDDVMDIIGESFGLYVDKKGFNYSRFESHFQYLIKRQKEKQLVKSDNVRLYDNVKKQYPETYACVQKIKQYLKFELDFDLNEEGSLYLILHVNRLCSKEDCYRKGITPIR